MKYAATLLFAALLAATSCMLASCTAFTKSDAQALGEKIAASSLAVATQMAAGQPVDAKAAALAIGLQAAGSVLSTVNANLSASAQTAPNVSTAKAIVASSHDAAQTAISNTAVSDPQIAVTAAAIATQAVAAAQSQLGAVTAPAGN